MSEPCELQTLVIDRSKWGTRSLLHGDHGAASQRGRMCCLGHALIACGNTPESIEGCGMPAQIHLAPSWIYDRGPTADAYLAAEINDHADPKEKEGKLIALFAKNGCQLSFVGELTPTGNK